jgi:hypothetical protein
VVTQRSNWMQIEVTNNDTEAFQPNFFARTDWRTFVWTILKGPVRLKPGQTARYTIGTDFHYRTVSGHSGGQIIVSDGVGDKGYRAVIDLPVRPSERYPRGFEGPHSASWGRKGDVWNEGEEVHFSTHQDSEEARVSHAMTLPFGDLSMELKRPDSFPEGASFGLEMLDQNGKRLSVLLGDSAAQGFYSYDHFYKILPSQSGWNSYSLDLRGLYAESGFSLPNFDRVTSHDVELIDRPMTLSFVLFCKKPVRGAAVRNVRLDRPTAPGHRIADILVHPREYQAVLGDFSARRRRFDEALETYRRAWPMDSAVRTTQEGSFLVVPGDCEFSGRFAMAGWGWGEVEGMGLSLARPMKELIGTIPILAKPGLKLQLQFEPPTPYSVRWDDDPWQTIQPDQTFTVPAESQVRVLSVIPDVTAGLKGIKATSGP